MRAAAAARHTPSAGTRLARALDPPLPWRACLVRSVAAPMMPVYKRLLAHGGLKMAIMSGDDDSVCATLGTQQFIWDLGLKVLFPWSPWFMEDGPTCPGPACKQVAGYAVRFEGLSLITVHGAGHLVPATRPAQGLTVLTRFLGGRM